MTYHLPLPGGRHVSSGLWPCRAVVTTAPKLITSAKREMTIKTASPLVVDSYQENRITGSFVLVDEVTNITVAAGMVGIPTLLHAQP